MAAKLYTSEAWLKKRYWMDKKSPEEIAKECGTSVETIYVYLAKFGLRKSRRGAYKQKKILQEFQIKLETC
jgi:hypothetical protein